MKKPALILLTVLFFVSACSPENLDVLPVEDNTRIEIQDNEYETEEDEDEGIPPAGIEH